MNWDRRLIRESGSHKLEQISALSILSLALGAPVEYRSVLAAGFTLDSRKLRNRRLAMSLWDNMILLGPYDPLGTI